MQKDISAKKDYTNQYQTGLYSIHLHNLQFFSPVGMYPEEKILGNQIEISLDVVYQQPALFHSIADTLDYEAVFQIVASHFQHQKDLLEVLALDIIKEIKAKFDSVLSVQIKILKKDPPIVGYRGDVGITLSIDYRN